MHSYDYVDNEVLNVEPLELVCLLYSKAIEKLNQAREHLTAGRIPERSEAIGRAMEIIVELQGSLNAEEGGEIAQNLDRLYLYIQERLLEANAEQQQGPLDESIRLLSTLYEGWKECRDHSETPALPTAGPSESAEADPANGWTL